jgi:cytidylate kinase
MIITLSGPAASGKGTLAKMLAKELNLPHYDFGLIFCFFVDQI